MKEELQEISGVEPFLTVRKMILLAVASIPGGLGG